MAEYEDFEKKLSELYDQRRVIDIEINLLLSDMFKSAGINLKQLANSNNDPIVGLNKNEENEL